MPPKFRGDSDDWLDNEGLSQARVLGTRPKKGVPARAVGLPPEKANAVVAEIFQNQCRIQLDSNEPDLLCNYRRAGVVTKSKTESRERTPVAVGDRVLVAPTGAGTGVIEGICIRKNCISRPAPGKEGVKYQHVLAANIDLLVIVVSAQNPKFSAGLVDRFLVSAESENIQSLICVTKIDLLEAGPKPWEIYQNLGYQVLEVSSKDSRGISSLLKSIQGKTVVFCGQSGVGKTSLLRVLLGAEIGRVAQLNAMTGKGRHTTTGAVLLGGPENSKWIDTPGIKEFGLGQTSPELLASYFKEFKNLQCPQKDCLHYDEKDCRARDFPRYSSYLRILSSLLNKEN